VPGQLEKGKNLGQYQIIAPLGKGGMASVYRAYQPNLDREVAIKVMAEQFASDPAFVERFRREARSIARLHHPNILTVYDAGEADGLLYIVMELIEGQTLKEELNGKPLNLERTAQVLNQVSSALAYANTNGIIHRDVKPTNVLIDKNGRAVLSDFGIAKMAQANTQLTGTGVGVGTPDYMSPEQAMGDELDGRGDEYSLGVMVYEMLTGRVPFTGDTPIAIVMGHVSKPLPSAREINPQLSVAVEQVMNKVLAKKATDRYSDCATFAEAFAQALKTPDAANIAEAAIATQVIGGVNTVVAAMPANPEAERLYLQARSQEQQNNFYGAFNTFNQLNSRFPRYRDVPTLLERYHQMGYSLNQGPAPTMSGFNQTPPQPSGPVSNPANYFVPQINMPVGNPTQNPTGYGYNAPPLMTTPAKKSNRGLLIGGGIGLAALVLAGLLVALLGSDSGNKKPSPTVVVAVPSIAVPTFNAPTFNLPTSSVVNPVAATPTPVIARPTPTSATQKATPTSANAAPKPTTTPGPAIAVKGLELVNEAYAKNGISISSYVIRQVGNATYLYGLMKNTTGQNISLAASKVTLLDGAGNKLDEVVPIIALHILDSKNSVPFMIFSNKAAGAKKFQWDFSVKPEKQDDLAKIYYADYNFKSEDYKIRDGTFGPILAGTVSNVGAGSVTNVQAIAVVFAPDKSVLFIADAYVKDKEIGANANTTFEVELSEFPKEVDPDKCTYDVWFEGLTK